MNKDTNNKSVRNYPDIVLLAAKYAAAEDRAKCKELEENTEIFRDKMLMIPNYFSDEKWNAGLTELNELSELANEILYFAILEGFVNGYLTAQNHTGTQEEHSPLL